MLYFLSFFLFSCLLFPFIKIWLCYIKIEVEEGYLTVQAEINSHKEENDTFVRRERYKGNCSRSFYVGKDVSMIRDGEDYSQILKQSQKIDRLINKVFK